MQEKTLYQVSFSLVLVGLLILLFYADNLNLEAVTHLDEVKSSEPIKLQGKITQLTTKDKALFLQLEGQTAITTDVVIFANEELFLQEGDNVEISGTIEEYNGKKEVVASKVVKK